MTIDCLICGRSFVSLAVHVRMSHKMSASEYKNEFGLMQSTPLIADCLSNRLRQKAFENGLPEKGRENLDLGRTRTSRAFPRSEEEKYVRKMSFEKIRTSQINHYRSRGNIVDLTCEVCGASVTRRRSRVKKHVYCSLSCAGTVSGRGRPPGFTHSPETRAKISESKRRSSR